VPQLGSSNNFPAGTNFHRIIIAGSGVSLSGNAIALNAGISSTQPSTAFFSIPVTLTGPQTFSSDGQGDLTVTSTATVSLNGHTLTFDINSTGDLLLQNAITGTGGVRCDSIGSAEGTGFGRVRFSAASGYSGAFTVVQGGVHLSHPGTLGTSASVSATGALFVDATANPVFTQPIILRGGLVAGGGTARYNGAITLPAGAQGVIGGDNTILAGRIQSTGSLLVSMTPGQTLTLTGPLANTFTGGTTVFSGDLILQKTAGLIALPGPVEIHSNVRLAAAGQIADTAALTMQEGSLLDLAGFNDTMASLTMTGASVSTGTGFLTLTGGLSTLPSVTTCTLSGNLTHSGAGVHEWSVAPGSAEPELQCDAIVTTSAGVIVRKTGPGSATFTCACAMSDFQIADGTVNWNGTAPGTFITMDGGTLAGTGTFNQLTSAAAGGVITPGTSPGILHGSNIYLNAATTLRFEINGSAAGTQYDQITIEDESALANATLDLVLGFTPGAGQSFTIVDSGDTGVIDTFAGLPEGAVFNASGTTFQITYSGGTGGDIILTVVEPVDPAITSSSIAPGTGPNAGQTVITVAGTGIPHATYVLETSTDLETWTLRQSAAASAAGTWTFTDSSQPLTAARLFARVRQQ
jgi:fibronectin-binding autotransporter adhesin